MWDLVPWPGIEPGSPALGVQSLTHGISRDVSLFKVLPFFLSSLEFMVHHFSYSFAEAPDHLSPNFVPAVQQVFTLNDPILQLFQTCPWVAKLGLLEKSQSLRLIDTAADPGSWVLDSAWDSSYISLVHSFSLLCSDRFRFQFPKSLTFVLLHSEENCISYS